MTNNLREILKNKSVKAIGLYTTTNFFTKSISFVALLFFVNILTEGDIGILNIFSNTIVFLTPVISLGVTYTISVDYFKIPRKEYASIFSTAIFIPVILALISGVAIYIFRHSLFSTFQFQPEFIWLIPICLIFNFFFDTFAILLRMENRVKSFSTIQLSKIIIELSLAFFLIIQFYHSWFGRALGYAITLITMGIWFLRYAIRNGFLIKKFDTKLLKKELTFGISGVLLKIGIFFLLSSDKFFVMAHYGKIQTGFYAIASTFATVQFIFSESLIQYLQPVFFQEYAKGGNWNQIKHLFRKYAIVMFLAVILITLATTFVYEFFLKPSYRAHLYLFYPLITGALLWSFSNLLLQNIVYQKQKRIIIILSAIAIVLSMAINFITSKYLNLVWLSYGQVISHALILATIVLLNSKLHFFKFVIPNSKN
ncbi:MAG: lipopolysaccharide biosynthesis protein [Chitinophagaceae bacterium]|nr:lipopolysaccharide biosynthesis protein [Chitinophagaceae bacterium]